MSQTKDILNVVSNLADQMAVAHSPEKFDPEKPFLALPQGYQVHSMKEYANHIDNRAAAPRRVKKSINFVEVQSFLDYFNKFKEGHQPQLFTTTTNEGLRVMCVFDYDEAAAPGVPGTAAKWNENRAYLQLAYSRDYKQLRDHADKWFGQEEFALFVEENLHLFVEPAGAAMLEIAQHLKGTKNVNWQSGKSLHNGSTQLEYVETIEARSHTSYAQVPEYIKLISPMYEGFALQDIKAALRWKLTSDKKIEFAYRLLTKEAERKAEDEVKQKVSEATLLPLLAVKDFDGITAK